MERSSIPPDKYGRFEIKYFDILMSGSSYYIKNMNGIISLSDGQGTTIENGQISTTDVITDSIEPKGINSSGDITGKNILTDGVVYSDSIDTKTSTQLSILKTTSITGSLSTTSGISCSGSLSTDYIYRYEKCNTIRNTEKYFNHWFSECLKWSNNSTN